MKNKEIWLDIKWYEELYQVSDLWRIKSLNYKNSWKEQVLKLNTNWYWYMIISLYKQWSRESFLVHRLVAQAFMRFSSMEINHIDWNRSNNTLSNLEYCTRSENLKHSFRELWIVQNKPMSWRSWKLHPKSIKIWMYSDFRLIKTFDWVREAARALNIAATNISRILKWKQKTTQGFTFKYI